MGIEVTPPLRRGRVSLAVLEWPESVRPMPELGRITVDPEVMGGKPCIRGLRVTVGTVVGLVAAGHTRDEILKLYPYLEEGDIPQALEYAAWRAEELELPLGRP